MDSNPEGRKKFAIGSLRQNPAKIKGRKERGGSKDRRENQFAY